MIKSNKSCMAQVPMFRNLSPQEIDEIIMIARHRSFDKGEAIINAGDELNSLFVVFKGRVKNIRYSEEGKEQVISILSPGDFFGELALFYNKTASSSIIATEATTICIVNSEKLKVLMGNNPNMMFKMMRELSKRIINLEARIEYNSLNSALAKLARLLYELKKGDLIILPSTKSDLASQLGISSETFSRKLKELENDGIIKSLTNKKLLIIDLPKLENIFHGI